MTRQKSTHIHVSKASGEIQYLSSEMKKALDKIDTLSRPARYKSYKYNKSNAILKSFHCSSHSSYYINEINNTNFYSIDLCSLWESLKKFLGRRTWRVQWQFTFCQRHAFVIDEDKLVALNDAKLASQLWIWFFISKWCILIT